MIAKRISTFFPMKKTRFILAAAVVLLLFGIGESGSAEAQTQQGSKLVASDFVGDVGQGQSVAISADGNTAIVGASNTAWIYARSNGVWTQQGSKLVSPGAIGGGLVNSVAISADGNTAAIGGPSDNYGIGATWIFTRSGANWTQQAKLVGSGGVSNGNQGWAVGLSSDGNTVVVGAPSDNTPRNGYFGVGAAWIFKRSNGTWQQQGAKLVGSGWTPQINGYTGQTVSSAQGWAVAISGDGSTVIVGGAMDDLFKGAVWFFALSGGVWRQQGNKLAGSVGSVALSADGSTTITTGGQCPSCMGLT